MAGIIAEGGFNTGRKYTAEGQRVYWWVDDDGTVTFYDRDRMIVGVLDKQEYPEHITPQWLMREYDANRYGMACQPARVPDDFDHGPALRL